MVEQFLYDLMGPDDHFPEGALTIHIDRTVQELSGGRDLPTDHVAKLIRDPKLMQDYGLRYIMEIQKDLVLVPEVIDALYRAVCRVALQKPAVHQEIPVIPDDAADEVKEELQE